MEEGIVDRRGIFRLLILSVLLFLVNVVEGYMAEWLLFYGENCRFFIVVGRYIDIVSFENLMVFFF